jgi:hypothetical protein
MSTEQTRVTETLETLAFKPIIPEEDWRATWENEWVEAAFILISRMNTGMIYIIVKKPSAKENLWHSP